MSIFEGRMPPNGINGREKKSVKIKTIEPVAPHGWLAQAIFEIASENITVGYEHHYADEIQLMAVVINEYGFERV